MTDETVEAQLDEVRGSRDVASRPALAGVDIPARLLTVARVAERLGYTERYVWRLGREGVLPRVNLPGRRYVRFAEEDVERLVRESRDVAAPRPAVLIVERRLPRRF